MQREEEKRREAVAGAREWQLACGRDRKRDDSASNEASKEANDQVDAQNRRPTIQEHEERESYEKSWGKSAIHQYTQHTFFKKLLLNWGGGLTNFRSQLLVTVEPLKRGLDCDEDQAERVDKLAQQLEKLNPTLEPLNSELINGKWRLMYTTSESILGKNKNKLFQPKGK